LIVRIAILDRDVLSRDEAYFLKTFAECGNKILERNKLRAAQKPNHRHRRLLRSRRERPSNGRAAKRGYELPSSDADCHLPRPRRNHARCNMGQGITLQWAGL